MTNFCFYLSPSIHEKDVYTTDVADEPNDADDLDEAIKDDYENPKPGPSHKE